MADNFKVHTSVKKVPILHFRLDTRPVLISEIRHVSGRKQKKGRPIRQVQISFVWKMLEFTHTQEHLLPGPQISQKMSEQNSAMELQG